MRIGIFGGTFNPIHDGHIYIAKQALKNLKLDKVVFIPNYISPLTTKETSVSFEQRFEMVQIAIQNEENMEVSDIEKQIGTISYTYQSLKKFCEKGNEYFLILGADQAENFTNWKHYKEILSLAYIVVASRGVELKAYEYPFISLLCAPHPASSGLIRQGDFFYLPKSVRDYVFQNELYLDDIVLSKMGEKRYLHCKSVQLVCIELAIVHGLDVHKASLCGLLHDICKEIPKEEMEQYMVLESERAREYAYPVHHQYASARYCQEKLQIMDNEIIEAIRYHTTGGVDNPYAYLLFIADKIEPLRGYDVSEEERLSRLDLKTGYAYCKAKQMEYIKKGL